ncbi:DUF2917 domain-containing protein [Cupriavidus sp. WKF15]|uniref:DUF2917 domain-containing protein n=1 Tax=Cupriavidus sp. WKF15 TaxID=3032282 RepID=UPI0023E0B8E3|nr:DUF2917 domain-containing protein [Cupriavidus sp. WKF15]WER50166.1 DUF2917 domain-containing protein [Cupriavidus sp. WKF15]
MQLWRLAGAATYTITLREGDCLRCLDGQVWITRECASRAESARDIVLDTGERLCARTTITCFVSALRRRPACIAVNAEAPAGRSPGAVIHRFLEEICT